MEEKDRNSLGALSSLLDWMACYMAVNLLAKLLLSLSLFLFFLGAHKMEEGGVA